MSGTFQPIQLREFKQAITEIPVEELESTKTQLSHSLKRLKDSNKLMQELLDKIENNALETEEEKFYNQDPGSDKKVYEDSIRENNVVIENQVARLELLNNEIIERGLVAPHELTPLPSYEKMQDYSEDNDIVDSNAPNSILI